MNTISRKRIVLLLGIVVLGIGGLSAWLAAQAWSTRSQASAARAGELAFQGALLHNWKGAITDECDFQFQLWDADINGAPAGDAVEVDDVGVRNGTFNLQVPAARLGGSGPSDWLAVAVRCGGEGEWETLAPRMQHQAVAVAGAAAAAGWDIPAQATLICTVPAADGTVAEHEPVIASLRYRLEGGFRAPAAGGAP